MLQNLDFPTLIPNKNKSIVRKQTQETMHYYYKKGCLCAILQIQVTSLINHTLEHH